MLNKNYNPFLEDEEEDVDEFQCPELRGSSYRIYKRPEKVDAATEKVLRAADGFAVRYYDEAGNPIPAPPLGGDSADAASSQQRIGIKMYGPFCGAIMPIILADETAFDASAPIFVSYKRDEDGRYLLRKGKKQTEDWGEIHYFPTVAAAEVAVLEAYDSVSDANGEAEGRVHVDEVCRDILDWFRVSKSRAETMASNVVKAILSRTKLAFDAIFPEKGEIGVDTAKIEFTRDWPEWADGFMASLVPGVDGVYFRDGDKNPNAPKKRRRSRKDYFKPDVRLEVEEYDETIVLFDDDAPDPET